MTKDVACLSPQSRRQRGPGVRRSARARASPRASARRDSAAALSRLHLFVRNGIPHVPLPQIPRRRWGPGRRSSSVPACSTMVPDSRAHSAGALLQCLRILPGRGAEPLRPVSNPGRARGGDVRREGRRAGAECFSHSRAALLRAGGGLPLAYQTAWRMIVGRGALRAGETVLIHGAGGGAAGAALDIAVLSGARVFATTSGEEKARRLSDAGAELVIDIGKKTSPPSSASGPANAASTSSWTTWGRRRG